MNKSSSWRRMAENEVVFRGLNKHLQESIDEINLMADEEGSAHIVLDSDVTLYFYCECSDEACRQRIAMSPKSYDKYHQRDDTFTLIPGHEVLAIEEVIHREEGYIVVKKYQTPPEESGHLHSTDVDNTASK